MSFAFSTRFPDLLIAAVGGELAIVAA